MTFMIDAWLDRPEPYLRIINRESGVICAQLQGEALRLLQDQGDLDLQELASAEPKTLKEQVRALFLYCNNQNLLLSSN